jgi:hypothetical protein
MKHKPITHQGIKYSAYSDRGKEIAAQLRRHRRDKAAVLVSALMAFTIVAPAQFV